MTAFPVPAQEDLSAEELQWAVDGMVERLWAQYSVPELGEEMAARLLEKTSRGADAGRACTQCRYRSNWYGIEVKPDIEVPAAVALHAALRLFSGRRKAAGAQSG